MVVGAGGAETCAVRATGQVVCRGRWRQPHEMAGLTDAVALAGGEDFMCALRVGGTVACWGANDQGQLDNWGSRQSIGGWGALVTDLDDAVAIAAGDNHACAVRSDGSTVCWGDNSYGQLGSEGSDALAPRPVHAVLPHDVVQIAAGANHTCTIGFAGSVWCWGRGDSRQTRTGWPSEYLPNSTGASGFSALLAGADYTCGLKDGGLLCWGDSSDGAWGMAPVAVGQTSVLTDPGVRGVVAAVAGGNHTCAIWSDGTLRCTGQNAFGQLGNSTYTATTAFTPVVTPDPFGLFYKWGFPRMAAGWSLATGVQHNCARTVTGRVRCWGWNGYGQLGDGTLTNRPTATEVPGLTDVVRVFAGPYTSFAVLADGTVRGWGGDWAAQLGDGGGATSRTSPVAVQPGRFSTAVAKVAPGGGHTCALTTGGTISCWGDNHYGQVGGSSSPLWTTPVESNMASVRDLASGMYHTCAVTGGGLVACWGANWNGQLGDGTTTTRFSPTVVQGLDGVVALAQGAAYHSCALRYDGTVWCWGTGSAGQLGDGRWLSSTRPVQVAGLTDATAIIGGFSHTCAIDSAGRARCWGSTPAFSSPVPIAIDGLSGVTAIGGGGNHTCALTEDGVGYCFGMNYYGTLGDGTTVDHSQPAPVIGL